MPSRCWARRAASATAVAASARVLTARRAHQVPQFAAERVDHQPESRRHVVVDEGRLAQGQIEIGGAPIEQVFPSRGFNVMRVDLQQDLAVKIQRPLQRQSGNRVAEAAVGVAALEIVVDPRGVEPLLQVGVLRVLPDGVLVVGQRLAPATLDLQLLPVAQHVGDLAAGVGDGDRGRELGQRGSSQQERQSPEARANADAMDP